MESKEKPVRILQVVGGLNAGGIETFIMNVYRNIDRTQVQFDFIKHEKEKQLFEDEIITYGGLIYTCPKYTGKNHFEFCNWWKCFFIEHPEYHVLHSHIRGLASIYIPIANKEGLTTIIHSHSTSNGTGFGNRIKNILQLPLRFMADYFFACSDEAGIWLFGKNVVNKDNYFVVPNGITISKFKYSEASREQIRKEYGIGREQYVIGHVGRFNEQKNHSYLIDVFREFLSINPNSLLMLVGDGFLMSDIQNQVKAYGIEGNVIFTGAHMDVERFYSAFDLFAFPSNNEGLGIVLLEAQASGLPCVISGSVPRSAVLNNNIITIELDESDKKKWVDAFCNMAATNRTATDINNSSMSKYDIKTVSNELQEFYINVYKEGKKK